MGRVRAGPPSRSQDASAMSFPQHLCAVRNLPSEAWTSRGMFVEQDGGDGGGVCRHRLQEALAALGSGLGVPGSWGCRTRTRPHPLPRSPWAGPIRRTGLPCLSPAGWFRCPRQEAAPACQLLPVLPGSVLHPPHSQHLTWQGFPGWARKQPDLGRWAGSPAPDSWSGGLSHGPSGAG